MALLLFRPLTLEDFKLGKTADIDGLSVELLCVHILVSVTTYHYYLHTC